MNSGTKGNISFLQQAEIDLQKWDQCVSDSANGLIYGHSFYLSRMAKNWAALVLNDYEAVMPLTWNRKYGIRYLYQPPFTAQLGIFSRFPPIDHSLINAFVTQCEKHFRFCEMRLNYANLLPGLPIRANYILDLQNSYEQIRRGYRKDLNRNLKNKKFDTLIYTGSTDYQSVVDLHKNLYGKRFPHVTEIDFARFSELCRYLFQEELAILREVKDRNSGALLAAGIFFVEGKRIYNIMPVTLPDGRHTQANPFLLDQLIREYSGKNIILDLEGSEISGIAEFYRKFGSSLEPCPFLRFNHLPFPIRLLK
ncbi:MAG: hypothetical protein Q8926_07175 [Bacteroidota bacterium]|nr:hypothetical protein [Bacteroidota bacterium]